MIDTKLVEIETKGAEYTCVYKGWHDHSFRLPVGSEVGFLANSGEFDVKGTVTKQYHRHGKYYVKAETTRAKTI